MDQTKTMSGVLGYINNIVNYFSAEAIAERKLVRKKEHENWSKEFKLHEKKHIYIDSLQLNLGHIIREKYSEKKLVTNFDKGEGYFIVIGDSSIDKKTRTEIINPNIVISLNADSIDRMILTVSDKNPENVFYACRIYGDDDFKYEKAQLCEYMKEHSARLFKNKNK